MQASEEPDLVTASLLGKLVLQRKYVTWIFYKLFSLYIFHQTVTAHKFSISRYTAFSALQMPAKWIFTFAFSFAWI